MATATTTQEITTMKIVTRIYLDDNGNCTCERHASAHLTASIIRNPFAHIHTTARGTWERMTTDDIRLDGADISCDRCESTTEEVGTCPNCPDAGAPCSDCAAEISTDGYKSNYDTSKKSIIALLRSLDYAIDPQWVSDVQAAMIAGNEGDFDRIINGYDAGTILDTLDPCHD